jgi:hypothetical protein
MKAQKKWRCHASKEKSIPGGVDKTDEQGEEKR